MKRHDSRFDLEFIASPGVTLGLFFVVAACSTWPLPLHFRTALPTGTSHIGTVPMLNAWTYWWNGQSASSGLADYWNAPIFHPVTGTLAFSEPQSITCLFAPLRKALTPIEIHNCYLLLTLALNGWTSFRMLRKVGVSLFLAFLGGLAIAWLPIGWRNLEAIQLLALWPFCLACTSAVDCLNLDDKTIRWWPYVSLGFWSGLLAYCCLYWFAFSLVTLWPTVTVLVAVHGVRSARKGWFPQLAVAAATCALVSIPIVYSMHSITSEHELTRSIDTVRVLSAEPTDWLYTAGNTWWNPSPPAGVTPLCPGSLRILIVALVLLTVGRVKDSPIPPFAVFLLGGICLLSFAFSFGANLQWRQYNIWEILCSKLPGFAGIRSPFRFAYFVQLTTILLAVIGLERLRARVYAQTAANFRSSWFFYILLASATAFETIPNRSQLCYPPVRSMSWHDYVADNVPKGQAIVCLPVASDGTEQSQERETRWMMHATLHGVPILNGYSGFTPKHYADVRRQLRSPENMVDQLLELFESHSLALVVVDRNTLSSAALRALEEQTSIVPVFQESRFVIYEPAISNRDQ
ncbi:MAG TPA: hypothetical protein DDW52_00905 [Planctomycetaceae bacterium]|nr:hypothetical protein [Planctomycetaceae bacterium]